MGMEMSENAMYSGGDGFGGGNMWVLFLFFLMAWGRGGFGWGGDNVGSGANFVNNDFLYTNLKNTADNGFMQVANQNFAIQKDLCQGFGAVTREIAESRFADQNCCCETNRNIDAVRYEGAKNTCDIITAIHNEGEATRQLITQGTIQDLRDRLEDRDRQLMTANFQLSQQAQSASLVRELRPCPVPAYPSCSPYAVTSWAGCGCGC